MNIWKPLKINLKVRFLRKVARKKSNLRRRMARNGKPFLRLMKKREKLKKTPDMFLTTFKVKTQKKWKFLKTMPKSQTILKQKKMMCNLKNSTQTTSGRTLKKLQKVLHRMTKFLGYAWDVVIKTIWNPGSHNLLYASFVKLKI